MENLIESLNKLNYSNTLDTQDHRWSSLVNTLEKVTDPEATEHEIARALKKEGFSRKSELLAAIELELTNKIFSMKSLLAQVGQIKN